MKALSIIFLIIISPLVYLVLFGLAFKFTIFNPQFVKKELRDNHAYTIIYNNFPEIGAQIVGGGEKDAGGAPAAQADNSNPFSQADTIAFAKNILTPQLMQSQSESFIDSVWPWLFSGKKLVPIATGGLKTNIYNGVMDQFRAKYNALPVCRYAAQFNTALNTCRPAGVSFDDLVKQVQMQKFGNTTTPLFAVNNIPDNFDLGSFAAANPKLGNNYQKVAGVQDWISPITKNFYFLPAILFIILVLLARLFAGAWKKTPMVFGIYLFILAGIFYVLGLLANKLVLPQLIGFADKKITVLPNIKSQLLMPLARDVAAKVGAMQFEIFASAAIFSVLLIAISIIVKKVLAKRAVESAGNAVSGVSGEK